MIAKDFHDGFHDFLFQFFCKCTVPIEGELIILDEVMLVDLVFDEFGLILLAFGVDDIDDIPDYDIDIFVDEEVLLFVESGYSEEVMVGDEAVAVLIEDHEAEHKNLFVVHPEHMLPHHVVDGVVVLNVLEVKERCYPILAVSMYIHPLKSLLIDS